MVKKRVHELAKELNLSTREVIARLKALGIEVKNNLSALEKEEVERFLQHYNPADQPVVGVQAGGEREAEADKVKMSAEIKPQEKREEQINIRQENDEEQSIAPKENEKENREEREGQGQRRDRRKRRRRHQQERNFGLVDKVPDRPPDRRYDFTQPQPQAPTQLAQQGQPVLSPQPRPQNTTAGQQAAGRQPHPPQSQQQQRQQQQVGRQGAPAAKAGAGPEERGVREGRSDRRSERPERLERPERAGRERMETAPGGRTVTQQQQPGRGRGAGSAAPARDKGMAQRPPERRERRPAVDVGEEKERERARGRSERPDKSKVVEMIKVPKVPTAVKAAAEKPRTDKVRLEKGKQQEKLREERSRVWEEIDERLEEIKLRPVAAQKKKVQETPPPPPPAEKKPLVIGERITVQELAEKMKVKPAEVIKKLMMLGVLATINQEIDSDTATLVASEFGYEVEVKVELDIEQLFEQEPEDDPATLEPRPCVVTVMGHVDHGKTSLLDAIRETNVTATEAGGITQHIGAYQVEHNGQKITFLDTPGHEAFTAMRARGAQVTDIAVLVVAADDGVMPQTVEAINHAKAAGVPIVVAINKIDKPDANPERVKQQLTEYGLVPEEWGGDTIMVPVSARTRQGISDLLEMILLVAEMAELKANPNRPARGTVIEAKLDKGRGPVATVLVQKGTLNVGDNIVAGIAYGRVRAMIDDKGRRVKKAGPSTPVEVLGLSEVPSAGDQFIVVPDEKTARQIAERRLARRREEELKAMVPRMSLDALFKQIKEGQVKELPIIIKADVQGSVEALRYALERLSTDEVRVHIIHGGVGAITETDIMLASASNAIIIGFNVRPDVNARKAAEAEKVDIRLYRVIYEAIDDVKAALSGLLEPEYREVALGRLEVRKTFKVSRLGTIAGCYVLEGKVTRDANVRLVRDGVVVYEGRLESLKRFKDDVREVAQGYECGLMLHNFNDIQEGDIIEAYTIEAVKRQLA